MILTAIKHDKKLRHKLTGTILILLLCRILYCIPTPGVNPECFRTFIDANATLGLMNALSGGALSRMTIAAFGISPFISATIITQILSIFIQPLSELQKRKSRNDEKKMDRINMSIALIMAFVQSFLFAIGFGASGLLVEYSWFYILLTTAIWTGASVFISKMGKLIQDRFIGNGVSLILFMNIVCGLPSDVISLKNAVIDGHTGSDAAVRTVILIAFAFAVFFAAYFVQVTQKQVPVTYSGKLSSNNMGKQLNYLPIKLCPGSVMPVVFTGAVFSAPVIIFSLTGTAGSDIAGFFNTSAWFDPKHMIYSAGAVIYAVLIIFFTFLYNNISANPVEIAEAIEKRGGIVADKKPGQETVDFIKTQTKKMLLAGSVFIIIIAILPMVLAGFFNIGGIAFFGTSILIITGTVVETYKELFAASLVSAERKKFNKKGLIS